MLPVSAILINYDIAVFNYIALGCIIGYALEAAKEVVRHLTEDLHVIEIYGDCDERNIVSSTLLERLGFKLIETVDDAYKEDADGNPIMIRSKEYKLTT